MMASSERRVRRTRLRTYPSLSALSGEMSVSHSPRVAVPS